MARDMAHGPGGRVVGPLQAFLFVALPLWTFGLAGTEAELSPASSIKDLLGMPLTSGSVGVLAVFQIIGPRPKCVRDGPSPGRTR